MAKGDSKVMAAYTKNAFLGAYNHSSDTIAWSIIIDTFAAVDDDFDTLVMANVGIVASAGNYTASTPLSNVAVSLSGQVTSITADDISVAANPANPVTGRCIAFFNDTSPNKDILCVMDMTTDGTTAVDLTNGFTDKITSLLQATSNA